MSHAPSAAADDDGAHSFAPQEPFYDDDDDDDDEDAEQPTDQQIVDEIGLLYHQSCASVYGAASALNAVLQGPYFDDDSLATLTGGTELDAYAMNMALQSFALTLQPIRSRRSSVPLHLERAFLCFHEQQWYAFRRFGVHWMHLRDTLQRPCNVEQLELCLSQQQADGCEIYVVCGKLPHCSADERSFWQVPFSWHSLTQQDAAAYMSANDAVCVNDVCATLPHCMCGGGGGGGVGVGVDDDDDDDEQHGVRDDQEAFDRRFEEDMRAAIAASLQDLSARSGGAAAMRIKRDVSSGVVRNGADGGE